MSVHGRNGTDPWPRAESAGWGIRMVGFGVGSIEVEVPGGGVVWVFGVKIMVVAGPVSTVEVSWAEGALEAASSSESSELRPLGGISAMQ